jgi:hypothetical protein
MRMPKTLVATLCLSLCALAQAASRPGPPVRPFIGFGLTAGGDKQADFIYSNGTTSSVSTGGLVHLKGGVDIALKGPMSLQLSLGYHSDSATAANGSYTFSRMPLEVLAHVALSNNFRLGGGLRWALDPRVSSSGVLSGYDATFNAGTSFVAEGEFFPIKRLGIKLRLVRETFDGQGINRGLRYDGSHAGAYVVYYFR